MIPAPQQDIGRKAGFFPQGGQQVAWLEQQPDRRIAHPHGNRLRFADRRRGGVDPARFDRGKAQRAGVPLLLYTEGYRSTDLADLPHLASFSDFRQLAALIPA